MGKEIDILAERRDILRSVTFSDDAGFVRKDILVNI